MKGTLSLSRPFALVVLGMAAAAVVIAVYGPQSMRSSASLFEFICITLFVFIFAAYGYRALSKSWTFWLAYGVLFVAHCIVYFFALRETGPWRMITASVLALIEIGILSAILMLLFHVSPQSGPGADD